MSEPAKNDRAEKFLARHSFWLGLVAIAIVFIAEAVLSWRKWPDPLIDFGQQLYVPWRLATGAVLYHDVSYVYGGLSVCYHALLFKIFGVSLNVLLVSNFLILGFLLVVVYRCFQKSSDVWTATAIGLALTVLAFGQFLDVGNYNYITPYAHEALHGIALAIAMLVALAKWLPQGQKRWLMAASACLGLIGLTKPEIFLGAAFPFALAIACKWRRVPVAEFFRSLVLALVFGLIPPAGLFCFFCQEMNFADALRAVFGAWLPLLHAPGLQVPFYRQSMGLDAPWHHLWQMLLEFGGLASIVGVAAWRLTRPRLTTLERLILLIAVGAASINFAWQRSGHALPLLLLAAGFLWWWEWAAAEKAQRARLIFPALWLAFSLALLAKLGFNLRISHYGIFLAMPAFLSAFFLLLHQLPQVLKNFGLPPETFRAAMFVFLLAGLAHLAIHSSLFYRDKNRCLGSNGDEIITYNPAVDPTGAAMAAAAGWIESHTAPTNTLAVLPEGVMLNYLARRINPTPYAVFAFEVWAFGEKKMLAAYQKNPPDYIVLIHRDDSEYGVAYFGQQKGFGYDFMQWVNQNYQPVWLVGHEPLQTNAFGIKILQARRP